MMAMLMEAYFQETRTRFHGIDSATFRKAARQRGLETDECYCLEEKKEFPDIAIEVILSSGTVDKLEIYWGLRCVGSLVLGEQSVCNLSSAIAAV